MGGWGGGDLVRCGVRGDGGGVHRGFGMLRMEPTADAAIRLQRKPAPRNARQEMTRDD